MNICIRLAAILVVIGAWTFSGCGPATGTSTQRADRDDSGDAVRGSDDWERKQQRSQEKRSRRTDADLDGIPNRTDKCPNHAEDFDDFQDEDGCPDSDNDQDGVPDHSDQCPALAGSEDNKGCPARDQAN